jgi:hypothetical protein
MTPSAAYPYYDTKPMQFRGVKVRAEPPVRANPSSTIRLATRTVQDSFRTEECSSQVQQQISTWIFLTI